MRVHSDQTEFCVSYDFLIASSRAPIVKAPLSTKPIIVLLILFFGLRAHFGQGHIWPTLPTPNFAIIIAQ